MKSHSIEHGLSPSTVEKICAVFKGFPAIERAVLYGSRAKGTFKAGSDIDLTLYGVKLTSSLCATIAETIDELLLPYEVDLSVFDTLDHLELREHIARVGVVFFQRPNQTQPIAPKTPPAPNSQSK